MGVALAHENRHAMRYSQLVLVGSSRQLTSPNPFVDLFIAKVVDRSAGGVV